MPKEENITDTTLAKEPDIPSLSQPVVTNSKLENEGDSDPIDNISSLRNGQDSSKDDSEEMHDANKLKDEDDNTKLKQSENGTLLSCGGEFGADDNGNINASDLALSDIQTASDIRFFICGTCKNNPILIGSTPKLLPCLHSFCDTCLKERYEKQKQSYSSNATPRLKCPSCGQEFLVAANDHPTSGFLNNQFVIESTPTCKGSIEPDNHQCTSCDDKSIATSYCLNCNEWLCDVCVKAHQRVKVTKDHIIQKQSGRNSPGPATVDHVQIAKEKPLFCKIHAQEQLKLFCANCDKLTCRDCQLVEHKDHRYQFIDEAALKHRDILKKLLQYLQINLGLLKETIVDVEKVSDGLSSQEKEIEKEIEKAFQSLTSAIKTRQEQLVKELKNLISTKQSLLAKQKKDLTQMRIILEHNHDFADFAVKGGSNIALLYSRKVLGTRLHNLNSLKYRQRPLALTDLKFSMDVDKLTSYFCKVGAVYSHEDMQRKIDNYSSRTPNTTVPRTMVLSSRIYSKSQQSPVETIISMNKRATVPNVSTSGYINLSKQGSLGIAGQQSLRSTPVSPKTYNLNVSRHPSSSNQEMIVLSSSSHRSNSDISSKKDSVGNKYIQHPYERHSSNHSGKTSGLETNSHFHIQNYQQVPKVPVNHEVREFKRSIVTKSPIGELVPAWSNSLSLKSNTIDQLRKMVEEASTTPVSNNIAQDTKFVNAVTTSTGTTSVPPNRSGSNTPVTIKEEDVDSSEHMGVHCSQDGLGTDGTFDEGQNEDYCGVCRNGGQLLCCDSCPKVYHLNCHIPALTDLPSDSWSCGLCFKVGPETKAGSKRRHADKLSDLETKLAEKILLTLFVHPDSLPFHHKVSKVQVPDYYKVITKPMDLMTVLTKMNRQHFEHYRNLEEFISDIRLIFSNCFIYNSADSEVCKMGRRLENQFDGLLKRYAPEANAYPGNEPKLKRRKEDENEC